LLLFPLHSYPLLCIFLSMVKWCCLETMYHHRLQSVLALRLGYCEHDKVNGGFHSESFGPFTYPLGPCKQLDLHRVPKLATHLASNTLNSVWSSWISMKYRTLHYLYITFCHTYYDIRTLPSMCAQCDVIMTSEFADWWDELDQRIIDKAIKQWCIHLRACVEAKGGHFEHKL